MYVGLLTTDKSGPGFESPAALKAAVDLQMPTLWGKLQCFLNVFFFSFVKGKDRQKQAALGFVEVREIVLLHSSEQARDATTSASFLENK